MSDFATVARPYGKALFELAAAEKTLQQWQDNLQQAAVIAADADMLAMFEQPAILAGELAELFVSVCAAAGVEVDADFSNLIALLAENDRLAALPPAPAAGFSIDDSATTEVDAPEEAFSLTNRRTGLDPSKLVARTTMDSWRSRTHPCRPCHVGWQILHSAPLRAG